MAKMVNQALTENREAMVGLDPLGSTVWRGSRGSQGVRVPRALRAVQGRQGYQGLMVYQA